MEIKYIIKTGSQITGKIGFFINGAETTGWPF